MQLSGKPPARVIAAAVLESVSMGFAGAVFFVGVGLTLLILVGLMLPSLSQHSNVSAIAAWVQPVTAILGGLIGLLMSARRRSED